MSNEKMREEFVAHMMTAGYSAKQFGRKDGNEYENPYLQDYFEVWTASRAPLCVELPKIVNSEWACTSDECAAMRDAIRFCKRAIESTGVRVI